ncbi:N-6 DNA methylase [Sphaerimonospora thailandensis]|uniref:Type II restriction endonuclease subunit M n=1 Tax=Sphaerimonospora thailandensis TaxID=795644 RepID=A0A8J3R5C0_9ACTN|nr:N-6 DNA methylase [Sphaerimonospora thailandensis]GIH68121.1 type II restriction endonuclease subunit M [Sphaerimonospora thailandensis]
MGGDVLLTGAEIARLAGIDRAAVSNWRRRYDDFPQPVGGTAASPLFSLEQVEVWLRTHRRKVRLSAEGRVWQQLRAVGGDLRLAEVLTATGWFLHYLRSAGWSRWADATDEVLEVELPREIRRSSGGSSGFPAALPPRTAPLFRAVADLAKTHGETALFEFFIARFLEAHQRSFAATLPPLAAFMVRLMGRDARTILDPACGTGTLLVSADSTARRLLGQEIDPDLAGLAAVRLALMSDEADVRNGDALRADAFSGVQVDGVICNPPFNERDWGRDELAADPRWEYGLPPGAEPELAWVQHALAHVKPGGLAVMLMPVAAAGRRSGRRIRAELIRRGALRAVIEVPSALASSAGIPAHLWLLKRPLPGDRIPSTVLFAAVPAEADTGRLDEIIAVWERFQAEPYREAPEAPAVRAVSVLDLLDDETDLNPSRYLALGRVTSHDVASLSADIEEQLATIRRLLPKGFDDSPSATFALTTLADLAAAGVLTVIRPGKSEEVPSTPGDVVVIPGGERLHVEVVAQPTTVSPPQQLVRVNPDLVDAQFLAGFLRSAHNLHAMGGSSTSQGRRDIRRAVVPRLPALAEQRVYGAVFQRAEELRIHLLHAAEKGEQLVRAVVDALTSGHLPSSSGGA